MRFRFMHFVALIVVSLGLLVASGGPGAYAATGTQVQLGGNPHRLDLKKPLTAKVTRSVGVESISSAITHSQGSQTGWNVTVSGIYITDIVCPSSSICYGVGVDQATGNSEIISTSNGGTSWSSQPLPVAAEISSISCPGPTTCWAVGRSSFFTPVILATSDGQTWTTQNVPTVPGKPGAPSTFAVSSITAISCPSTQYCVALGGPPLALGTLSFLSTAVLMTANGGMTWTALISPSTVLLTSLSCATLSDCMAVGPRGIGTTTDGGTSWTLNSQPGGGSSVTCLPNTQSVSCWVGQATEVLYTANFGSTWATQVVNANGSVSSISCSSSQVCVAVGSQFSYYTGLYSYNPSQISQPSFVATTSNAGSNWVNEPVPTSYGLSNVSCPSTSQCFASSSSSSMTGSIYSSSDGGASWSPSLAPASNDPTTQGFTSMSCPTQTQCWAIQSSNFVYNPTNVLYSSDGGNSWTVQFSSFGISSLEAITCPSTNICWAVGSSNGILGTSNGGTSWNEYSINITQPIGQFSQLKSVSCYDTSHCIAIGNSTLAETSDGKDWYIGNSFPVGGLNTVYCQAATLVCWVVGGDHIYVTQNGGSTWTAQQVPSSVVGAKLSGFTCESQLDCWAAGTAESFGSLTSSPGGPAIHQVDLVLSSTNGGQSWSVDLDSLAQGQSGVDNVKAITCLGQSCYMLASQGYEGDGFNVGGNGGPAASYIVSSTNFGATWVSQNPVSNAYYTGINCQSQTTCSIIGIGPVLGSTGYFGPGGYQGSFFGGGIILSTTNGGVPGPPQIDLIVQATLYTDQIGFIVVTGTNFSSTTQVTFNGVPISIFNVLGDGIMAIAIPPSYAIHQVTGDLVISTPFGSSATGSQSQITFLAPVPLSPGAGYWVATQNGQVDSFGGAPPLGELSVLPAAPIVSMAATPDGDGYWLVGADGGVFAFGDAKYLGSTGGIRLSSPIVSMAATPDGDGYWLVGADGGVFAFGDANYFGSTGGTRLSAPIVSMAATPNGDGYWLVGSDGGVFAFGDAQYLGGEVGSVQVQTHVDSITSTPDGKGYWILASGGGVYSFGDASYFGTQASNSQSGWAVKLVS